MKRILALMVAVFFLSVGSAAVTTAAEPMDKETAPPAKSQGATQTLQGEVVKIDGEFYVVKDPSGKEVRLHVDKRTNMIGNIKQGSKVEAQFTQSGHASMLKALGK